MTWDEVLLGIHLELDHSEEERRKYLLSEENFTEENYFDYHHMVEQNRLAMELLQKIADMDKKLDKLLDQG